MSKPNAIKPLILPDIQIKAVGTNFNTNTNTKQAYQAKTHRFGGHMVWALPSKFDRKRSKTIVD